MGEVVHLRAYSQYSLLYSAARIEDLAQAAKADGMSALGIADRGGMYGSISCYQQLQQAGVRPVLGSTITVVKERNTRLKSNEKMELLLIAESLSGYQSLVALSSQALLARDDEPCNTWSEVAEHAQGLICLTGGSAGPLGRALETGGEAQASRALDRLQEIFGRDQVYVELQSQGLETESAANRVFAAMAGAKRVKTVATSGIRHIREEDIRVVDVLQGIKHGMALHDAVGLRPRGASYHFRTMAHMRELFREYPDALANTLEIANRAAIDLPLHRLQLPHFPVSPGQTEEQELRRLAFAGLKRRFGSADDTYQERLEHELQVISRLGYAGYFLIVWDFMRFAHERGISTGPGRGSAAGSLVAYVLFITDVDPIAYGLLFERFLNPERVSWPDIDIDFETERRYEVLRYVAQKYGVHSVAQIGTLGTFAARAAIRDVGRVLQTPSAQIESLVARIPGGPGVALQGALNAEPQLQALIDRAPNLSRVVSLALAIEGLPRHPSIHAAGVVIAKGSLQDSVPVMAGVDDLPVTQYDMVDVEAMGLLKMDFLGLRTLTICDRTVRYIEHLRGMHIQYDEFTLNKPTLSLLAKGDTDGCFQLESNGVKQVLKELQPNSLEDLIAVISLYRPGPMEQIGTFIKARRGIAPVKYDVPALEPILAQTYGILVYQEQIMQIAALMAGFSLGQADVLRRAVGKKKWEVLDAARAEFVLGCAKRGYNTAVANQIYDLIERFADYGFNRSHAAAYAVLAFRTAYLKANFRPEFMAALITDSVSRPEKVAQYALACRREGIPVLIPDINQSIGDCVPEKVADGVIGLRLGLYSIRNVGTSAVEAILREREQSGLFASLSDALSRLDNRAATKRVLESLIQAGAFDSLGGSRTASLALLDGTHKGVRERRGGAMPRTSAQLSLLGGKGMAEDRPTRRETVNSGGQEKSQDRENEIEAWEKDLIGFVVSRDPYEEIRLLQERLNLPLLIEEKERLEQGVSRAPAHFAGRVAAAREVKTKKGEAMAFYTVEDASARVELVAFPSVYRLLDPLPEAGMIVQVTARLDSKSGTSWIVSSLQIMAASKENKTGKAHTVYIKVTATLENNRKQLNVLRELLLAHPGSDQVTLVYESGKLRRLDAVSVEVNAKFVDLVEAITGSDTVKWV